MGDLVDSEGASVEVVGESVGQNPDSEVTGVGKSLMFLHLVVAKDLPLADWQGRTASSSVGGTEHAFPSLAPLSMMNLLMVWQLTSLK